MRWLDMVKRDPVPWLLDPVNPSVRLLTLRYVFARPEEALQAERAQLLQWEVVRQIRSHWIPVHFWGRARLPYYGGAAGNFGTLYLLAQMAVPRFEEVEPVCENLLNYGRRLDGSFSPEESLEAPWLCYTGMAMQTLWHFGYGDDLRAQSAQTAIVEAVRRAPRRLLCPVANGECNAGLVKALAGLLCVPSPLRDSETEEAILLLAGRLLDFPYDFQGRDAVWLKPVFPRYYNTDLVEACRTLAQTALRDHPRFRELVRRLVALQNEEGRWVKARTTPILPVERVLRPSRWLTFEAVHALASTYGGNPYAS